MRIALALLIVAAGCRQILGIDEPSQPSPSDGAVMKDVSTEALAMACTLVPAGNPMVIATSLGESPDNGTGTVEPDLVCPDGSLPIGIGFESTSNKQTQGGGPDGERVVTGIAIQCGTIGLSSGALSITPTAPASFSASPCPGFSPLTVAPITPCPKNSVVVGLTGNGGPVSTFNTAALTCALVTGDGMLTKLEQSVPVADTDQNSNNPQAAACPPGEAIVAFSLRAGCGIDELTPQCAPLRCK